MDPGHRQERAQEFCRQKARHPERQPRHQQPRVERRPVGRHRPAQVAAAVVAGDAQVDDPVGIDLIREGERGRSRDNRIGGQRERSPTRSRSAEPARSVHGLANLTVCPVRADS